MKYVFLAAAAFAGLCEPALAMSDSDCTRMWTKADTGGSSALTAQQSERYSAWMRSAGKTAPADGIITQQVFLENCKADVFKTASAEAGAPFSGANSFTESQAKDRAMAAGYSSISALTKDANGIWRGTAMKDGKNTNIAVDYKGNVVAG